MNFSPQSVPVFIHAERKISNYTTFSCQLKSPRKVATRNKASKQENKCKKHRRMLTAAHNICTSFSAVSTWASSSQHFTVAPNITNIILQRCSLCAQKIIHKNTSSYNTPTNKKDDTDNGTLPPHKHQPEPEWGK